jgi:alpha-D-ribose 1-methylphosphonate 5-triphosphate synthase subunit PhnH
MTATLQSQAAPAAGFTDPVHQSQQAFRVLLDAMARPGRILSLGQEPGHPAGLAPALAAALLTLCDLDTPVWLGPGFNTAPVRDWLRFHTGAPLAPAPGQAAIVLLSSEQEIMLDDFSFGTDEAPERGATLLIQVSALSGTTAMTWRGPGIKDAQPMPFCGLPAVFWRQRAMLGSAFPRGLDIYLSSGSDITALPRSTAITVEGA